MYTNTNRKFYHRPPAARSWRSIEAMAADSKLDLLPRQVLKMPPANLTRPQEFGVYNETTDVTNPSTNVVASGCVLLYGTKGTSDYSGTSAAVTLKDAIEGELVACAKEGRFYFEFDHAGDAGASPARVAGSTSGLRGRPAYWMPVLGLVTDQKPAGGGQAYIQMGTFVDDAPEIKPNQIAWGIKHALVDIRENADGTAVEPATAGSSSGAALVAFAEVSDAVGLTVDLYANIYNSDPNNPIPDAEIKWTIDGGAEVTGNHQNATLGSAGTKAITLDVSWNGFTLSNTYNLVVAVASAPTLTQT